MSHSGAHGKASGLSALVRLAGAGVLLVASSISAAAQPPEELAPFFAITETRLGVLKSNLDGADGEQADVMINGEVLFSKLGRHYEEAFWEYFLRPRPHIGFSISPNAGTDQVYAGVTWEYRLTDWAFVETSFGGAAHNGPTAGDDPDSYGCTVNFRKSASVGFDIAERLRLMVTVDHMSNAGLCDQNQGLTNAGVRLGYRW